MLWTIVLILLILWLLGGPILNLGALIHLLLVIALIVLLLQLITGRRVVLLVKSSEAALDYRALVARAIDATSVRLLS